MKRFSPVGRRYAQSTLMLAVAILSVLSGCGTPPPGRFRKAMLVGVVVDTEGRPVPGARVRLDLVRTQPTAMNGRFAFHAVRRGLRKLTVSREGFETATVQLEFTDRREIAYVRMVSRAVLIERAVTALEGDQLHRAADLLSRARGVHEPRTDPDIALIGAVLAYRQGDPSTAADRLQLLREKPETRPAAETLAEAFSRWQEQGD